MSRNNYLSALAATIFLLTSFSVQARITDKQEHLKISKNKIELTVNSGFHLNAEAPASAQFDNQKAVVKPSSKTEKLFVFVVPEKSKKAQVKFYVCDDARTACEQHESEISITAGTTSGAQTDQTESTVVATANESGKTTLLMFSAPWCPACIRMQTETYNQKEVINELSHVAVKKINIDLPENAELSEKYHVKAIPTAVLINQDGDQIGRWLDFQSAATFSKQLRANIKNSDTILALEKKALSGDAVAITKVGMSAYNSMNCKDAVRWLSLSHQKQDQKYKLASEVTCAEEGAAEDDKNKKDYLATLDKASMLTTSKLDQLRWNLEYLEKSKENKVDMTTISPLAEKLLEQMNSTFNTSVQTKKLFSGSTIDDTGGFETEEVLLMKSKIYSILDKSQEKQAVLEEIKTRIAERKLSIARPGEMLIAIAYLKQAGDKVQVEKLYNQLIAKYPTTYVYLEKKARYLFSQKQNEMALEEINKAMKYSEGNQPQLWLLKAKILKDLDKKVEALTTVNEILSFGQISHRKYKKILAQSETLKKDLTTDRARD